MLSSSTASVEDLPDPAAPVTSTIPSLQLGHFRQLLRQAQGRKVGNGGGNDAHHHGATAALNENVDAEPRQAGQSEGNVASPMLAQGRDRLLVVANQVGGDVARVVRREQGEPGHLHRNHLPVDLDLRRTSGREDQVADLLGGTQHGAQQSRSRDSAASRETF